MADTDRITQVILNLLGSALQYTPRGGSGIGLTIARYLVEAHQGHIYADSPGVNQGSMFVVELPVLK